MRHKTEGDERRKQRENRREVVSHVPPLIPLLPSPLSSVPLPYRPEASRSVRRERKRPTMSGAGPSGREGNG